MNDVAVAGKANDVAAADKTNDLAAEGKGWEEMVVTLLNLVGLALSVVLVVSISIETFSETTYFERAIFFRLQFFICLYFLLDFLILLAVSRHKRRFLLRNFFLIFIAIPYIDIFDAFSIHFSEEVTLLMRFIPIIRGGAAVVVLVKAIVKKSVTTLFISYIIIFFSVIYFLTLIFYTFETGVNPEVKNYTDAVWWAAMTVTTLGSSITPITVIGKVSTTLLAVVGMTTFPIFTVYITSLVQDISRKQA